jgi:hypothetical protein
MSLEVFGVKEFMVFITLAVNMRKFVQYRQCNASLIHPGYIECLLESLENTNERRNLATFAGDVTLLE